MKGFEKVKIAVSCRSRRGAGEEDMNFKKMVGMVEKVGAIHSNTVHKRVSYVISTDDAYRGKTQRIRKAAKYKIPVIKLEWLRECIESKKMLDFHPFVLGDDYGTAFTNHVGRRKTKLSPFEKPEKPGPTESIAGNSNTLDRTNKTDNETKKEKKSKKKKKKKSKD